MASDDEKTRLDDHLTDAPADLPGHPERIGRFQVRGQLGEGGMGVVYDAWDPELKRRVAVKLLRPALRAGSRDTGASARLQREAETMARVSHPNVAHIYEVGQWGGAVFLAMEFIEGDNLREWLERRPRSWRDVVAVFLQAGHGLAAAHAVGIVHRDFKPDNVLVGLDGRTRVLDFGLAFPQAGTLLDPGSVTSSLKLTRVGVVVGTPAYISPEQHLGQSADARSDQFSFCVALHEALHGERPFRGDSIAELRVAVFRPPSPPTRGARVPRRLQRLLARGLQPAPERRYPDMPALLADLAVDPAAAPRRLGLAAALGLVAAATALVARPDDPGRRCRDLPDPLADLPPRLAAARDGVLATAVAYAPATWPKVQLTLDAWAAAHAAARADACLATHVDHTASDELLHLRDTCLDAGLRDLHALLDALAAADATTVERALAAAQALPDPADCRDEAAVRARVAPPTDPVLAPLVADARARLAAADTLARLGRARAARALADDLQYAAVALDHAPLHAEILLTLGRAAEADGDLAAARGHLVRAFDSALASAHDAVAVDAALHLADAHARELRHADALVWARHAAGMIARTGDRPRPRSLARLHEATALARLRRLDDATALARALLARADRELPPGDLQLAHVLLGVAAVLEIDRAYDDALALYRRVHAEWSPVLGHDHPLLARAAFHAGRMLQKRDRGSAGVAQIHLALAALERTLGKDHPDVAEVVGYLSVVALDATRLRDAVANARRAEALHAAHLGQEHPRTTRQLEILVEALSLLGEFDEAIAVARRHLALRQARQPRDDAAIDLARVLLADVLLAARRLDDAEAECLAVLQALDRVARPQARAYALHDLATIARLRGDPRRAEGLALRALALVPDGEADGSDFQLELGEDRLALGRADEALADCTAAMRRAADALAGDNPNLVFRLLCLGRARLARGALDLALPDLERAVAIATAHELRPDLRAEARADLARALRPRDKTRAAAIAAAALTDYDAAGPAFARDAARLAAAFKR